MPLAGTLRTWNDDRGFGFIAPTHGGPELFVHISAFPNDGSRPVAGESLIYELGRGKDGKPQAVRVTRQAIGRAAADTAPKGAPRAHRPVERSRSRPGDPSPRRRSRLSAGVVVALLVGIGAFGYSRIQPRSPTPPGPGLQVMPASPPGTTPFRCDGRTHCSQMTSCAEARYFLANCPGVKMDGNNDGVPCEQQWCTGPLGR